MTYFDKEKGVVRIQIEPEDDCELCGKHEELRPYGPNGERVCWSCAHENPLEMNRRLIAMLEGRDPTDVTDEEVEVLMSAQEEADRRTEILIIDYGDEHDRGS